MTRSQTDSPRARVERAREGLILNPQWRYFGFLSARLAYTESLDTKSMSTDGTRLYVNPSRVMSVPDATLRAWLAKSVLSCALLHPWRMGEREPDLFNRASAHVCNLLAQDAGLPLAEGAEADRRFVGMVAEQVYAVLLDETLREQEQQRQQQQPPEPQPPQSQPGEPEPAGGAAPSDDQGEPSDPSSGGAPDPDQPPSDDGQPSQGQPGDGQSDDGQPGDGPGAPGQSGSGSDDGPTDPNASPSDSPSGADDGVDDSTSPSVRPPPARSATPTPGEPEPQSASDWRVAAEQTALTARKRGTMPGSTDRMLVAERAARADWRAILREFVGRSVQTDFAWHRPNRRFVARGLYLPGRVNDGVGEMLAFIDTSGSIRQDERESFAAEVTSVLTDVQPSRVRVIYCDTRVQHVDEFTPDDGAITVGTVRGGGTAFQPALDYAQERIDSGEWEQPVCALYLTDLMGDEPTEPAYPVLWITSERVRAAAPFGDVVVLSEGG